MATAKSLPRRTGYTTAQVASLLGLPAARIRSYVRAGFLDAERSAAGALLFTFQDLVLLKTAKGLVEAGVPAQRIVRALKKLRSELPQGRPLASLRISAIGDRVVAHDPEGTWEPESGQTVLDFSVAELAAQAAPFARQAAAEARRQEHQLGAHDWFSLALDLEASEPDEARDAYRRVLELSPDHGAAHVNLGRLLHEQGDVQAAENQYRAARRLDPDDPTPAFNLGVALQDQERLKEAADAYEKAIALADDFADAYFNLAFVMEKAGKRALAIRYLKTYKKLVGR